MKKSILISFALIFGYLFYQQSFGINVLLFIPFILLVINKAKVKINLYAICLLITGISVFVNLSISSIVMLFLSLFAFISKSTSSKLSIYLATFAGAITSIIGSANILVNPKTQKESESKVNTKFWFLTSIIILPVLFLFIYLYSNSNPIFNEYIQKIDFSFISIGFIATALAGFVFLLNISSPLLIKEVEEIDEQTPSTLLKPEEKFSKSLLENLKFEHLQASLLIGTLNFLLVLFLITDVLLFNNSEAMQAFKENVHNSVYTLIVSIIFAITIISIYFRGNLNFYHKNQLLKRLANVWVILNTLLVLSTLYKNWYYIDHHGLTFKRIGVIVYLLLTIVGLYYTFRKIQYQKTFWYILKNSTAVGFFLFTVLSLVPYGKLVTYYNLNSEAVIDVGYLLTLPKDNAFILWEHRADLKNKTDEEYYRNIESRLKYYETYLEQRDWQSYTLDNLIYKD
ncbi:hypothetical protein NBRC110019_26430 [Neptunitalea chrysea]|uniref:DUF4173 domain-containing protein n=1 Tax=Neptunitalea chrysea TaxID=1647581 RepID=A0A9W6EWA2_9FLAO|nr:DUF4153 domain-containing protein [Neptunitalea chrysea]GLB53602.1 hypothetical protein NBRC110019_26430 [Neptunitalea chrysea]